MPFGWARSSWTGWWIRLILLPRPPTHARRGHLSARIGYSLLLAKKIVYFKHSPTILKISKIREIQSILHAAFVSMMRHIQV